jgi:hypothetical protein
MIEGIQLYGVEILKLEFRGGSQRLGEAGDLFTD